MACCTDGLLSELKDLANQIGDCCTEKCCPEPCCEPCCQPCCPPCTFPFAQVTMCCPPPILAPTIPQPVKPLSLPCPPCCGPPPLTPAEEERARYNNFYNNYNIDYHSVSPSCPYCPPEIPQKQRCCQDYTIKKDEGCCTAGCPTGFKPCSMKLTPPPCCDPCGVWCAQIQPCPPKPKNKNEKYVPGPCTRPCCKHWKPKEGPCLYDDPCKAHCFNHPPGMKPSGRWP
ncbi:keratin-associated protein 9-8-like isoform X1 [Zophobas morio]|uniref:keratin-associated protein 9-8-like isoform X1 n=1 Tax=Zophobas morio TaxID=2755281 RepID=UPI003082A689